MSRIPKRPTVFATRSEYLDPGDCNSVVSYKVYKRGDESLARHRKLLAEITLSDCNRKIDWYFDKKDPQENIDKIDKALELLSSFRDELLKAQAKVLRGRRT